METLLERAPVSSEHVGLETCGEVELKWDTLLQFGLAAKKLECGVKAGVGKEMTKSFMYSSVVLADKLTVYLKFFPFTGSVGDWTTCVIRIVVQYWLRSFLVTVVATANASDATQCGLVSGRSSSIVCWGRIEEACGEHPGYCCFCCTGTR
jgi:hypothetical protein